MTLCTELAAFAAQYAETLYKTCSIPCVITDRDSVIACAGVSKKEVLDRRVSRSLETVMEKLFQPELKKYEKGLLKKICDSLFEPIALKRLSISLSIIA